MAGRPRALVSTAASRGPRALACRVRADLLDRQGFSGRITPFVSQRRRGGGAGRSQGGARRRRAPHVPAGDRLRYYQDEGGGGETPRPPGRTGAVGGREDGGTPGKGRGPEAL